MCFIPISSQLINCRKIPIGEYHLFSGPPTRFPYLYSILEKGHQSHETGELNSSNLGPGQPDLETRGESHEQWLLGGYNDPEHLNQPIQRFPDLSSRTKKIAVRAVRQAQAPWIYLGEQPPSFRNSSETRAESL